MFLYDFTSCFNIFTDGSEGGLLLWIIYVISVLFLLCFRARLFINMQAKLFTYLTTGKACV